MRRLLDKRLPSLGFKPNPRASNVEEGEIFQPHQPPDIRSRWQFQVLARFERDSRGLLKWEGNYILGRPWRWTYEAARFGRQASVDKLLCVFESDVRTLNPLLRGSAAWHGGAAFVFLRERREGQKPDAGESDENHAYTDECRHRSEGAHLGLRFLRRFRLGRTVEGDCFANERLEGGLVHLFSLMDVDRAAYVSFEA